MFTIEDIKKKILPLLKEAGIAKAAVFGSVARGEAGESSDVDLLVEPPEYYGLMELGELKTKLEDVLGKKVDVVTYRALHPLLRDVVLKEQILLT